MSRRPTDVPGQSSHVPGIFEIAGRVPVLTPHISEGEPRHANLGSSALGDLVTALTALDYSTESIHQVLGPIGYREVLCGNPGAALSHRRQRAQRAPESGTEEESLTRSETLTLAFFLREPVDSSALHAILGEDLIQRLIHTDVLEVVGTTVPGNLLRTTVDIRPVDHEHHSVPGLLIASDPDASLDVRVPGADHVPGVGQAPLSLLNQVPTDHVARLLDLGTGSGVLALSMSADTVVATDIHQRALNFGRASERSVRHHEHHHGQHRAPVDWREGSWFDPVTDELFDRIVSNPPFVVSNGEIGHIYRDSGLALDGASRLVASGAADHLTLGGTAHLLGAWATSINESPASRVAGWLPSHGIRAWVIQRDEVDPETYVRTWLSDESIDLRTPLGREKTQSWLRSFSVQGISRIGMGYLHLQKIDGPSELTFEEITTTDLGFFGDEVSEWFLRAGWLAEKDAEDILGARFALRPTVVRKTIEVVDPSGAGFTSAVLRLSRIDGPRFSHEVDSPLSAIVAGINPNGLTLGETAELYCAVHDLDMQSFSAALVPLIVDLVRHGLLLPSELVDSGQGNIDSSGIESH